MSADFTLLEKRYLRFDGVSVIEPEHLSHWIIRGIPPDKLRVLDISSDVELFNANSTESEQLRLPEDASSALDFSYNIPPEFLTLDVREYVYETFAKKVVLQEYSSVMLTAASDRVLVELDAFEQAGLFDLLRTIIYVLTEFQKRGQVHGVGRGSSCASYILFILGLHYVDSVKFDIELSEFLKSGDF